MIFEAFTDLVDSSSEKVFCDKTRYWVNKIFKSS